MKKMLNALLISLITFLPVHAKISTRTRYTRATQNVLHSYYHSLSTVAQSRTFDPLAALNIGSHDPDEEKVLKTKLSKAYKKLLRAIRSSLSDMRSGALKTKLFFKSKEGRRLLYETGLFAALMAGGYKMWLQNERAHLQNQKLLFELTRAEARSNVRAQAAQAERAQLRRKIAALQRDMGDEFESFRRDAIRLAQYEVDILRFLVDRAVAPNRAQVAAARAQDRMSSAASTARGFWSLLQARKAAFDAQLEAEEAAFDAALAADSDDDLDGAGAGAGVAASRFNVSQTVGKGVAAAAHMARQVAGAVHEVHTSAWNNTRSGDASKDHESDDDQDLDEDGADAGAGAPSVPKVWQPEGAGRMAWERR